MSRLCFLALHNNTYCNNYKKKRLENPQNDLFFPNNFIHTIIDRKYQGLMGVLAGPVSELGDTENLGRLIFIEMDNHRSDCYITVTAL